MSAPRTKRQFAGASSDPAQRQITSFFSNNGQPSSSSSSSSRASLVAADIANTNPSLSNQVQSNLLSVGMRVRKSVPEGYKTGTYSGFSLWDDSTSCDPEINMALRSSAEGRSRANAVSTPRELLPFCGLNKVGGMGTQPEGPVPDMGYRPALSLNDLPFPDDDMPGLSSSQDTVASDDSADEGSMSVLASSRPNKKRFFIEDEEECTPARPNHLSTTGHSFSFSWSDDGGDVSPRSLAPSNWGNRTGPQRPMAIPRKGGLRGKLARGSVGRDSLGQENVVMALDGSDFEEADFLDGNKNWEVEMSDL